MQLIAKCRRPDLYPAIVHVDGTSRVQTVSKEDNPEFRELLELWYEKLGCPMNFEYFVKYKENLF